MLERVEPEASTIFPQRKSGSATGGISAYVPALRSYISKRADPADVDDLVQDVLLRMHVRGESEAIGNIEGYLFQVAASVLTDRARRDRVRHRGAHLTLTETVHPVEELTPERVACGREDIDRLVDALEEMSETTRDVFVLHRFDDMSYDMIAEHLGISTSAVGRNIMKAVRFLAARDLP